MDPVTALGLAASIVQVIDATAKVIRYVNEVNDAPKERASIALETASLLSLFTSLRYRVEAASPSEPWIEGIWSLGGPNGPLMQFKDTMEQLTSKMKRDPSHGLRKVGRALQWPFDKRSVTEILARIERMKSLISIALQQDTFKLALAIKRGLSETNDNLLTATQGINNLEMIQQAEEESTILDWLSTLNFSTRHSEILHQMSPDTGSWILQSDQFNLWLSNEEKALWCPGMPGAGKTFLSSFIIDYLGQEFAGNAIGLAYVFCDYRSTEHTTGSLIASLLRQLVQSSGGTPQRIRDCYTHHKKGNTRPNLAEYMRLLIETIASFAKVFIVVDALDEHAAGVESPQTLIAQLRQLRPVVHLLVTSRLLASIGKELSDFIRLEIRATNSDVEKFVEYSIRSAPRLERHVTADSSLEHSIKTAVISSCDGMFLMAKLHIDSLRSKATRRSVRLALENLPSSLTETYDDALRRVDNQEEEDVKVAHNVLAWVTHAKRPLRVSEVQHALAVEPGQNRLEEDAIIDEDLLLSVCLGLVVTDQASNTVRLVHYTAQEYFERTPLKHVCNPHRNLATVCITYMDFYVCPSGFFEGDYSRPALKTFEQTMAKYPLREYASLHWGLHAREDEKNLWPLLSSFLSNRSSVLNVGQRLMANYQPNWYFYPITKLPGTNLAAFFNLQFTMAGLLENGADTNSEDDSSKTALHVAAEEGHAKMVHLLLSLGSKADHKDLKGYTPMHWAAERGHAPVIKIFLENEVPMDQPNSFGLTPIELAIGNWHEEALKALLAYPTYVVFRSTPGVLRVLLEHGADVGVRDPEGHSSLWYAVDRRSVESARLLFEFDAEISKSDHLMWRAARRGQKEMWELLEAHGTDGDIEDLRRLCEEDVNFDAYSMMRKLIESRDDSVFPGSLT